MTKDIIVHYLQDWSRIDERAGFWGRVDLSKHDLNFGIHQYNNSLWTSGQVGVGRLYDRDQNPIRENDKDHVVIISSSFGLDPWKMLETIVRDEEYDNYLAELEKEDKELYKIYYDQQMIKLPRGEYENTGILVALSYMNACYSLCKKGLKKTLFTHEENCTGKIHGRISISKNIKFNTAKGRCDRFYCKYMDFTEDNIENRIIKAALFRCRDYLREKFIDLPSIHEKIMFCKNVLRHASTVKIKPSDFNSISTGGLYSYYKPVIQQARSILELDFQGYGNNMHRRDMYVIPYSINMETLFEYYARCELKKMLSDRCTIERYSKRYYLQANVHGTEDCEKNIHLMPFCIPDIVVLQDGAPAFVIDAKYKPSNRPDRSDSHQLLSYALLTGAQKCGFIFPASQTGIKEMQTTGSFSLPLSSERLNYYELLLGDDQAYQELERVLV